MHNRDSRLFTDFTRATGGAAQAFAGIRAEIEAFARQQLEHLVSQMDLVPRDEFEAVKAMAAKARLEQEALEKRVADLEAALATNKA